MEHEVKPLFFLFFGVAVFTFLPGKAATTGPDPVIHWHQGAIVLADRRVLTGEFCVQAVYDLVLYRNGTAIKVYPAHAILSLRLYDRKTDMNRKYVSRLSVDKRLSVYQIYEIVLDGEIAVLRKQKAMTVYSSELSDAFDFSYFVVAKNMMYFLHQFRDKVYPEILTRCGGKITRFMDENLLSPNDDADIMQLIQFYNKHCSSLSPLMRCESL